MPQGSGSGQFQDGGTVAAQATTDAAALDPFSAVTITGQDPNLKLTAIVFYDAADGTLTDPNAATDGSNSGASFYAVPGTPTQVEAALRGLVFTPKSKQVSPGQSVTTTLSLVLSDGTTVTTDNTTSVVATALNSPPAIAGAQAGQATGDGTAVQPFAAVAVSDPDVGAADRLAIVLTDAQGNPTDANGALSGAGLAKTGTGTYALAAARPAALTASLDQLTFTPTLRQMPQGQAVTTRFALTATDDQGAATTDATTSVVATSVNNQPRFAYTDTATGASGTDPGTAYSGALNYLQYQYAWPNDDGVILRAQVPDVFLKSGAGTDLLQTDGGSNVLDGGKGSNFLIGGTGADGGTDTFFVDGRNGGAVWNTVVNFHHGDAVTLYGFTPGTSTLPAYTVDGATGYQGATIHSQLAGPGTGINASVTLAGISTADAAAKISTSTGTIAGIPYLYLAYTGT